MTLELTFPVRGRASYRDTLGAPRDGGARAHRGTDIVAEPGTPIVAMRGGRVVAVLEDASRRCGLGVVIDDDENVRWTYCHMEHVLPFERGQRVRSGVELGTVGDTGNARGGPHLHLQAVADHGRGSVIDLVPLLDALGGRSGASIARRPRDARSGTWWPWALLVGFAMWRMRR